MILYIVAFCCFITIYSFHIPSGDSHGYLTRSHVNRKGLSHLKLINEDEEFQGVIGYEATEKVKEKLPKSLEYLSQKLVRSILDHDLKVITEKSKNYKPKWVIRNNKNRFDPCYFKVGERLRGRVSAVFPTYALVDVGSTKYAVLHARDMSKGWVDRVDLTLSPKEDIDVYVKAINEQFKTIRLSLIPPNELTGQQENSKPEEGEATLDLEEQSKLDLKEEEQKIRKGVHEYSIEERVKGKIVRVSPLGFYIDIGAEVEAFLHINDVKITDKTRKYYRGRIYRDRNKYKIGNDLNELYVKSIDIIKNRIGVTENTLMEELERNVITRRETTEQQSSYLRNYNLDLLNQLKVRDIENYKNIGMYDEYLKMVGADRNASIPYLMFLDNKKKQKDLEEEQKGLFKDLSTKQKIRRDQDHFNRLTHEILKLNDSAYEPTNDEKSIYKYGGSKIWSPRIYTPFRRSSSNESDKWMNLKQEVNEQEINKQKEPNEQQEMNEVNRNYFRTLRDEIRTGLRDVQGENYNFSEKYEEMSKNDEPYKIINYLYEQFHKKPSNLSCQKDKYENQRQYVHSSEPTKVREDEEMLEWDKLYWKEEEEKKQKNKIKKEHFINQLLKSKDKDEVEIGEMLMETKDFDPFEHCKTFQESEESAFRGASRLFQDDVSQWNDRVYNMILSNQISLPEFGEESQEELKREEGELEEEIENIDPEVLRALDESDESDFTTPIIEDHTNFKNETEYTDTESEFGDFKEDIEYNNSDNTNTNKEEDKTVFKADPNLLKSLDEQIKMDELSNKTIQFQKLENTEPLDNLETMEDYREKEEEFDLMGDDYETEGNLSERQPRTKSDYKSDTKRFEKLKPKARIEKINVRKLISKLEKDKKLTDSIKKMESPLTRLLSKSDSNQLTSPDNSKESLEENKVKNTLEEIKGMVYKITNTTPPTTNAPESNLEYLDDDTNPNNANESSNSEKEDEFQKYVMDRLERMYEDESESSNDIHDLGLRDLLSNKDDFKLLVKFAKKNLSDDDLKTIEKLQEKENEYEEERMMGILKSVYSRKEKKTKYKYYKEGYDKFLERQERLENSPEKVEASKREMKMKLNILLKNNNFLNMLRRIKVDPKALTIDNVTHLLPHSFHSSRLTPSSSKLIK